MYRSIEDFLTERKEEESNTVKLFSNLTEESKSVKIHENVRSLERLAWHITQTLTEMGKNAGLFETDLLHELPIPATLPELIKTYVDYNTLLMRTVRLKWTDSNLDDLVNMYGEPWKKGKVLSVLIVHESHHRSQMTVIMRMLGLSVPGIYGPSKEEWESMGMPPMD
ncbi:hypothetical protein H9X96_01190 [Pedobacter sp. N36a]|uniref:DinB family protein n=1 Tax=Pedobacter sp. N36a TaxID=2767996 RepID=UPI0016569565|nr:DinB family protein [Pedobacter sp. N36a]MBC8984384.1 hypothetical protein [Pedobacter sp. N36a]